MKYPLLITLIVSSTVAAELISCEQEQMLCEVQCKATSFITEKDSNTCVAQCLGEWTACELEQGKEKAAKLAEQAKNNGQSMLDKIKAFWDGLSGK
ncbi:MAG: hypothetical protein ACPGEF_08060 [Endozoicomonas sp.]